jgi:hypothetical protein
VSTKTASVVVMTPNIAPGTKGPLFTAALSLHAVGSHWQISASQPPVPRAPYSLSGP